jgi:hypothetical protein
MFGLDPTLVTAAAAVLVAIISGFYSWQTGRKKNNVDYTAVIQTGFATLIQELQEQHTEDQKEIMVCQTVVKDLSEKVSALTRYIASLERFLQEHGLWEAAPKSDFVIPRNGKRS